MGTSVINQRAVVLPAPDRPLSAQAAEGLALVQANKWVPKPVLDQLSFRLSGESDGSKIEHLSVWLAENKVITKDQAREMDWLAQQGSFFPTYHLLKRIGSGGMGTVFLAAHRATGAQVALKTINAKLADERDFIGRFNREADALRKIHHPYIAGISDSGENQGHCFLAMEYIDGPSTMALLKEFKILPEAYAIRIAKQVAEGLANVWKTCGLVHRDLKPENILVARVAGGSEEPFPHNDTAKLIDFGLVKSTGENDERLTQTGMTIGTPLYMSPEQVRGDKLDCRSDIYGLGATLYHFLTGHTPYIGTSPGSIMSAHLTEPVPDPGARVPGLHESTRQLVMTAMAKKTVDRFRDHEAFITACNKALEQVLERSGGIKLMRKPLIRKPPVKRSADRLEPSPEAPAPGQIQTTGQIRRSDASLPAASRNAPGVESARRAATAPAPVVAATGAIARVRDPAEPQTAAVAAKPSAKPPASAIPPTQPEGKLDSAVFHEDPAAPMSMGMLPWIVLITALLALLGWLLVRLS